VAFDIHDEVLAGQHISKEKAETFERLEQAQLTRNQFLDNMSHELRTPLTAILGLSEALETGLYGDCSDEQREAFRTINDCGASLLGLINDILDVTKLETQKVEITEEPLQATEICDSIVRLHKKMAAAKRIEVSVEVCDGDSEFMGDRKRLKQVLSHLLNNAIKFSPRDSHVILRFQVRENDVLFQVLDEGPGISTSELPRLLTPFRQSDEGLARHYGGLGLGLSLAQKLVDLMRGSLAVRNREEGGAEFSVSLPKRMHTANQENLAFPIQGEGTILVVDDHEATVKLLKDALDSWGFQAETISSVRSLKERSHAQSVRAVLMDGKLTDGNGIECIRWLRDRSEYARTPIVFLTASQSDSLKRAGLDAGASAYLEKPIRLSQLSRCLQHLLDPQL
jgi:CheY-like chemotaxis protein/nitrogen-specific signal transduction histidine kinase